jgi:paraquat-inducible protein B
MSKRANPALIGAFIVGAIILAVAGVLVFGSGRFLKQTDRYVIFFGGSVKGLDIGAPVSIRGVRVGSVSDVVLLIDRATKEVNIKVVVEIERGKAEQPARENSRALYSELLKRGLKAKLANESLVTGKLYVDLDFYPDTPIKLASLDKSNPEIPTVPTDIEKLQMTLGEAIDEIRQYPIRQILDKVNRTMAGVDRMVNAPEAMQTLHSFKETVDNLQSLVEGLDGRTQQISGSLDQLIQTVNGRIPPISRSLEQTAQDTRKMLNSIERQVSPMASSLAATSKSVQETLAQANKALVTLEGATAQDSPLRGDLTEALQELTKAARSIRVFTDYLERHPESLIRGKGESGGK